MKKIVLPSRSRLAADWGYVKSIVLLLTYGIIEELLEEAIAWSITALAAKALSFAVTVALTGIIKVSAKNSVKGLVILIKPVVKKITYRQGNDKTTKLVSFLGAYLEWITKKTRKLSQKTSS